jgi:hypothetical protein
VLIIKKQKLIFIAKFEKWAFMTKLAKYHGTGLQIIHDMEQQDCMDEICKELLQ